MGSYCQYPQLWTKYLAASEEIQKNLEKTTKKNSNLVYILTPIARV